jgi:hypothetical protein
MPGRRRWPAARPARRAAVQAGQCQVHFLRHLAVADFDTAGRDRGNLGVVRDQHDGAALAAEFAEQAQDGLASVGVEVARRLVRENDAGVVHQGARDGHALLLAAGELAGPVPAPVGQAHRLERRQRAPAPLPRGHAAVNHGQLDVLDHVELGQEVEELEDEPDFLVAQGGQLPGRGVLNHYPVQLHRPGRGRVQATQDVHEGGLAAAPRAR